MSPELGSEVKPLLLTVLMPRTFSRVTWNDTHTKLHSKNSQFNKHRLSLKNHRTTLFTSKKPWILFIHQDSGPLNQPQVSSVHLLTASQVQSVSTCDLWWWRDFFMTEEHLELQRPGPGGLTGVLLQTDPVSVWRNKLKPHRNIHISMTTGGHLPPPVVLFTSLWPLTSAVWFRSTVPESAVVACSFSLYLNFSLLLWKRLKNRKVAELHSFLIVYLDQEPVIKPGFRSLCCFILVNPETLKLSKTPGANELWC